MPPRLMDGARELRQTRGMGIGSVFRSIVRPASRAGAEESTESTREDREAKARAARLMAERDRRKAVFENESRMRGGLQGQIGPGGLGS